MDHAKAVTVQTSQGMQVQFSRGAGKLTRIRLDTNKNGQFNDESDLLYRMDVGQRLTDANTSGESPKLVVSQKTDRGTWFGVQIDGQTALPAYLTWFVPNDQNLVFFRYQAKALSDCGIGYVRIAANLGTRLFTADKYWLPHGKQKKQKDYINIGYGFWDSYNDYPKDATGCIYVDKGVGLTYQTLNFVGGHTVYSRFTKGPKKHPNNIKGRAGWIRPIFELDKEVVTAGTELEYEFVMHVGPWQGTEPVIKKLASAPFKRTHVMAMAQMDQAVHALQSMQTQWGKVISEWDYNKQLDQLKLDMVKCQIDMHVVREALLDAQIAGELSGRSTDLNDSRQRMRQVEQAYEQMVKQVKPLNTARDRIGSRFSKNGKVEDAIQPLREIHDKTRGLQTVCRQQIDHLISALSSHGFSLRQELPRLTAGQRRENMLGQPLYSGCWIAPRSGVFNTVDSYALDLKKVRALGLQAINTSEHYMTMDAIVRRNKYPQARESAMRALLDPIRKADLKAVVGLYSIFTRNRNDVIPPELIGRKMAQTFRGYQTLDYENPNALEFREKQFADLASFLKTQYSDVVVGFDYDNEYAWNQNFSDYAKPHFIAYLKQVHGSIAQLNKAWQAHYATWRDLEVQMVMDKKNPVFSENTRDWWMYANQAFTYKHWGSIYRGLKEGWPQAVCVARAPRGGIQSTQRNEPGKKITDVIGGHWQKTTEGTPAPVLSAIAQGTPLFHTEFWWSFLDGKPVAKRYDAKTVALYQQQIDQYGMNELCALDGRRQMWEYFLEGTKGFCFFPNPPNHGNLLESNGMASDTAAAMTPTMRQVQALNDVIDQTKPDTTFGIVLRTLEKGNSSIRVGVPSGAMLMLQALNIPFEMVLERQVQHHDLSRFTHLWLNDTEILDDLTVEQLKKWVKTGGTLMLSGPAGIIDDYGHPAKAMNQLSGVTWSQTPGGKELILSDDNIRVSVADPAKAKDYQHAEGISRYLKNKFSKGSVVYSFNSVQSGTRQLASFETGKPAIVSRNVGQGRVFSMAVPVEEFLFTAVNLHDSRGEPYVRQLLGFMDRVLTMAKVNRPFTLDRLGDTQFSHDNVMAFYRKPKNDDSIRYLFLLNTGYAVNGKYGSIHYVLSPYMHEPEPAMTKIVLPLATQSVHELLRQVDVKTVRTSQGLELNLPLHPGRCYAFELKLK